MQYVLHYTAVTTKLQYSLVGLLNFLLVLHLSGLLSGKVFVLSGGGGGMGGEISSHRGAASGADSRRL